MTARRWSSGVVVACLTSWLLVGVGQVAGAVRSPEDEAELRAARAFAASVGAYVALEKKVVQQTAAKPTSTDAKEIAARRSALAASLVAARPDARQGDIFIVEVAAQFRALIHHAFSSRDRRAMRRTIREDDHIRAVVLRVNDIYPESIPITTMPPTLLRALPVLPPELAYRIVGAALVLQDVRTNLIVDVLPDAIPGGR